MAEFRSVLAGCRAASAAARVLPWPGFVCGRTKSVGAYLILASGVSACGLELAPDVTDKSAIDEAESTVVDVPAVDASCLPMEPTVSAEQLRAAAARENRDAASLAADLSPERVIPTDDVYERVLADVPAIRDLLAGVGVTFEVSRADELMVSVPLDLGEDQLSEKLRCVNRHYGGVLSRVEDFRFWRLGVIHFETAGLNLLKIGSAYAAAVEEVNLAIPNLPLIANDTRALCRTEPGSASTDAEGVGEVHYRHQMRICPIDDAFRTDCLSHRYLHLRSRLPGQVELVEDVAELDGVWYSSDGLERQVPQFVVDPSAPCSVESGEVPAEAP